MAHRIARIILSASLLSMLYCAAWLASGCALSHPALMPEPQAPNTNAILRVMTRFGMCHACPVAVDLALISAHCVDMQPFDPKVPAYGGRYSNADGTVTGIFNTVALSTREDLAVIEMTPPVGGFYLLAKEAPELGQTIWWLDYDYRSRKNALKPKQGHGELVEIVAGNIVVARSAVPGSSGGCTLTANGELVAIVDARIGLDSQEVAGLGIGVWGNWADELLKTARERIAKQEGLPGLEGMLRILEEQP